MNKKRVEAVKMIVHIQSDVSGCSALMQQVQGVLPVRVELHVDSLVLCFYL